MTTPTPSDAAMAAAKEHLNHTYHYSEGEPGIDYAEIQFRYEENEAMMQSENALATIIDRHFAPLREELEWLDAQWQKVVKEVLACDPIPACRRADDQLEPPWEVIARIRAENAKLRAALEEIASYDKNSKFGDGVCPYGCDCPNIARGALAPERKETT